jgi:hypothetical protein
MTEADAPIPAPSQDVAPLPEPVEQDVTANPQSDGQDVAPEPDAEPEAETTGESVDDMLKRIWPHCGAAMSEPKSWANSQAERSLPLLNYLTERRRYTWPLSRKSTNFRSALWRVWRYAPRYWQAIGGSCGSFTYRAWTAKHQYAARK